MEQEPKSNHEMFVTRGQNFYKSVGISVGLGLVVACVTYSATTMTFNDTFRQTIVRPLPPVD